VTGQIGQQLIQLFHSADGGVAFARLTAKLLRAFECWCNEVEAVLAALSADRDRPDERLFRFPSAAVHGPHAIVPSNF